LVELLTSRRSDASDNNSSSASVGDGTGSVRADGVESDGRGEDSSGSDEASGKKRKRRERESDLNSKGLYRPSRRMNDLLVKPDRRKE